MNKKRKTYLLLIMVLGLWGTIGYQIIAALNPKEPKQHVENLNVSFTPSHTSVDTFSISQIKRDPFLGKLSSNNNKKKQLKSNQIISKVAEETLNLEYLGVIRRKNAKQQIFIIAINGVQHLFKIKQEFEEVKLLSGTTKSITVRIKGKNKTIKVQ